MVDRLAREILAFDRGSARSFDVDDRLHVDVCNISKATVNPYFGREIPGSEELGLDPAKVYRLYRDPAELERGAPTFARLQLLDTHVGVNAADPKMRNTVGTLGSDVRYEHPYLKSSLTVWDAKAIQNVLKRLTAQLSCSYRYRADMTPGVSPEGVAYDGVMRDIIGNHVALVREGRAGPDVYVNDSLPLGLTHMAYKFPALLATIGKTVPLSTDQKLALDAAFDKAKDDEPVDAVDEREAACDEREEAMDAAEEKDDAEKKGETARGDRKAARDMRKAARDKRAKDKKGRDSDPTLNKEEEKLKGGAEDKAPDLSKYVTKTDADKMAKDAADAAVARVTATEQAKRDVAPLVGQIVVAMDSAEAVYRFALDQKKVDHKGVHPTALSAIVAAEIRARSAPAARTASDAAPSHGHSIDNIFKAQA